MTKSIGFGVLGAGRIGRRHARNVAAAIDHAHLVSVYDASQAAAQEAAFGSAEVAPSVDALLARSDVDAVIIASPTPLHVEQIEAAAQAGKAIFCEKPISLAYAETVRALDTVKRCGVPFQLGFNRRFDPGIAALADGVRAGSIGAPELFRSLSSDPAPPPEAYVAVSGGLFLDSAIHDFDLARWLLGDVKRVTAVGRVLVEPYFKDHQDVDTSVVTLEFESGALGVVQNSRRTRYGYEVRVEVLGSEGKMVAEDAIDPKAWRFDASGVHAQHVHYFLERFEVAYQREVQAFVDSMLAGEAPSPGPQDALASLEIALAARESVLLGSAIDLEGFRTTLADTQAGGAA